MVLQNDKITYNTILQLAMAPTSADVQRCLTLNSSKIEGIN